MCEPATIAVLALTVASTAVSYRGQQQAAKSQARYYKQAAEEGEKLAKESLALQSQQMALRSQQEAEAKSQAIQKTQTEFLRAKSTAKVASGESGVAGTSIDQLLADFDFQEDLEVSAIKKNASYAEQQLSMEKLGLRAQTNQKLSGLRAPPVSRPSAIAAGLQIAGAGAGAYARYKPPA